MIATRLTRPLMLIALVAFVLWGFGRWRFHQGWQQSWAEAQAQAQSQLRQLAEQAQRAEASFREQEQRWQRQQQQARQQADSQLAAARRDAADARAVTQRLHQQVGLIANEHRGPATTSAAAVSSPPAADSRVLLAELFFRADRETAALAEYADRARIAGQACQQAWPEPLNREESANE